MTELNDSQHASLFLYARHIIVGWVVGVAVCGLPTAGYGSFLHFHRDYMEAKIQEQLRRPHPDSVRYLARVQGVRYLGHSELMWHYGSWPAFSGGVLGIVWALILIRIRRLPPPGPTEPFIRKPVTDLLFEGVVVTSISLTLISVVSLQASNFGLVFYGGRNQFDWLDDLEHGQPGQIDVAISATCALLSEHRFTCRSQMIPALATWGSKARVAVPILRRLLDDEEVRVREAAAAAIAKIEAES